MLSLLDTILAGLRIDRSRARDNIRRLGGEMFSQRLLLKLSEQMGSRDRAYALVQRLALARDSEQGFEDRVRKNAPIRRYLNRDDLDTVFDFRPYLRRARAILKRALAAP
jgi:adenylosuccinate lyase